MNNQWIFSMISGLLCEESQPDLAYTNKAKQRLRHELIIFSWEFNIPDSAIVSIL